MGEEGAVNERAAGPAGRPGPACAGWREGGLGWISTHIGEKIHLSIVHVYECIIMESKGRK